MELRILGVDSDAENASQCKELWNRRGFLCCCEFSMQSALARVSKESFYFTFINADTINYIPFLNILRNKAQCSIFIFASYTTAELLAEAAQNGADMYSSWQEEDAYARAALAIAHRYHTRGNPPKRTPKILSSGWLNLIPAQRRVLFNDKEIHLVKSEYDVLNYLMVNCGDVLSYDQIHRHIWHSEFEEESHQMLFSVMKRLRKKIREVAQTDTYIENSRGYGYRVPVYKDTKR